MLRLYLIFLFSRLLGLLVEVVGVDVEALREDRMLLAYPGLKFQNMECRLKDLEALAASLVGILASFGKMRDFHRST